MPRGLLEFWIDPKSPYHKPYFAADRTFVFYCAVAWRSALATRSVLRYDVNENTWTDAPAMLFPRIFFGAALGADGFYSGPIAEAIVATQTNARVVADAADQAKLVGRMTLDDLANYEAIVRKPVVGDYRGFRIASMGPPSSGGLTAIYILKLLEQFPIGDASQGFGFGSTTM